MRNKNLKELIINRNQLSYLPEEICYLDKLEMLLIGQNNIKYLPQNIGKLKQLKTLVISGNPIDESELMRIKNALPNTNIFFNK